MIVNKAQYVYHAIKAFLLLLFCVHLEILESRLAFQLLISIPAVVQETVS